MLLPILLGFICCVFIYLKFIKPCWFWKNKGCKYAKAWPGVGSLGGVILGKDSLVDVAFNLYNKYPEERYVGYQKFRQQCLLIRDIDLIQQIANKDVINFADHAKFGQDLDSDFILSKSLVGLTGKKWKNLRATISPIFTSNKIRNLYFLIEKNAKNFVDNFDKEVELEIKDTFTKVACNIIASTAFGVDIDCFKDPKNDILKRGLQMMNFTSWQSLKLIICQTCPKLAEKLQMQIFPSSTIKFFKAIIIDNIKKRETEGIVSQDLIHLLLEARKGLLKPEGVKNENLEGFAAVEEVEVPLATEKIELTDDYIVAQALTFFLSGFDTVSNTCSFMAYELAVNSEVQKTLHDEIDNALRKNSGEFLYEAILEMKYLDQVVSETLRKWPVIFESDRLCNRDYQILPKRDDEKAFLVKKGVDVVFPIMAIHKDPKYYPEPERFDPERFNVKNKSKVIPGTYLPFGSGPRNCIGSRLALLEIKTVFSYLMSKFEIVPIAKTEIPIKIKKGQYNLAPEKGLWLGLKPRKANF